MLQRPKNVVCKCAHPAAAHQLEDLPGFTCEAFETCRTGVCFLFVGLFRGLCLSLGVRARREIDLMDGDFLQTD